MAAKFLLLFVLAGEFHCGFEDGNICLFTQDDTDNFDWTKQSTATRDTKYTPNTGPNADRTGSKEGKRGFGRDLGEENWPGQGVQPCPAYPRLIGIGKD